LRKKGGPRGKGRSEGKKKRKEPVLLPAQERKTDTQQVNGKGKKGGEDFSSST